MINKTEAPLTSDQIPNPTTEPVFPGTLPNEPEFVRIPQLFLLAGLKRGVVYRRIHEGTFKSVLLREKGNRQGIRLIHWPSVKEYLHSVMAEQDANASEKGGES